MSQAKYNTIGEGYNQTRKADPYLSSRLYKQVLTLKSGSYLDIGCGTGNYTCALHDNGLSMIGIDPSEIMLKQAKLKSSEIDWRLGMAEDTGLEANSIQGITANLTVHHWTNHQKAFYELYRILKPGAKLVIFTSTPQQMRTYWLSHYFPNAMIKSEQKMPELDQFKTWFDKAGFTFNGTEIYNVHEDLQDQFLQIGKTNPELYFREDIRSGISTFSDIANKDEVNEGLATLRNDIDTGQFGKIVSTYETGLGDYIYITAIKQRL